MERRLRVRVCSENGKTLEVFESVEDNQETVLNLIGAVMAREDPENTGQKAFKCRVEDADTGRDGYWMFISKRENPK